MLECWRGEFGGEILWEGWSSWFGDRFVLMFAQCEEAEDSGFCACAAAAPRAECDGAGDAGGIAVGPRLELHHVDARVSDDLEDVGSFRPQKFIRLFKCILQAWWLRLRHAPMAFY